MHKGAAPELAAIACKVLSISMSGGSLERTWSSYSFIHSKRRNRLREGRADKLVDIYSNMQMYRKGVKLAALHKEQPTVPWGWIMGDKEEEEEVEEEEEEEEELLEEGEHEVVHVSSDEEEEEEEA